MVLWYDTEAYKSCAPTAALQALVHWVCVEIPGGWGITKVVSVDV